MRYLVILSVVLGMVGCVASGIKVREEQLQAFQRGMTTYQDVVQALGPPTSMTLQDDGSREASYVYTQAQAHWQNFVPFVGPLLGGQSTEQTSVILGFDPQQILVRYSATQGQLATGTGLASGARQ